MNASKQQESEQPLLGEWRFNGRVLCCGTLRIAIESIDTNPTEEFKAELFGWIVNRLNAATPATPSADEEIERIAEWHRGHAASIRASIRPLAPATDKRSTERLAEVHENWAQKLVNMAASHANEREELVRNGREAVHKRDEQIDNFRSELVSQELRSKDLEKLLYDTEAERQTLIASLAAREAEIAELKAAGSVVWDQLEEAMKRLNTAQSELATAQSELSHARQTIINLRLQRGEPLP